jgi:ubiquinone/menaquinone biosynthesis C-methylase UbiE
MITYDDIAEWYDQWVGTYPMHNDPFFSAVEALMGDITGHHICDLACGQGRVSRYLADRGAHVVGIDLSTKLLKIARRHEVELPRGIKYLLADAQNLDVEEVGTFNGVICFMALMDIPELAPIINSVARILRPDGWFVFSILHPCFHTSQSGELALPEGVVRTIRSYFVEGYWRSDTRSGPPGKVGVYHRSLSTYINTLADEGLTVERMSEPCVIGSYTGSLSLSGLKRPVWAEVPTVLVARCRKDFPKQDA